MASKALPNVVLRLALLGPYDILLGHWTRRWLSRYWSHRQIIRTSVSFFPVPSRKKVLFNFQKLTSAEEQTTCGIQSECMPCGKNIFFTSFSAEKKLW